MPPPTPAGLGCLRRANFTSPAYRYLVAYEINALGWKERLVIEIVIEIVIAKRGYNFYM